MSEVSSVADMQEATGAAMSPAKSQKYFDKYAEQMNELDENAALVSEVDSAAHEGDWF